jgi:CRP-like cAMP-binding protein
VLRDASTPVVSSFPELQCTSTIQTPWFMGVKSSFDVLKTYLEARGSFTAEEFALLRTKFIPLTLRRGEFLQRAGAVAKYTGFIASGCARKYTIDTTGKEHIVAFAPETWWVADGISLTTGTPSQFFIDAIEDSDLLLIDPASHEQLVERVPGYEAAYRRRVSAV